MNPPTAAEHEDQSIGDEENLLGVLLVELSPDWWLPEGYSLQPSGTPQVPISVIDPLGNERHIYATEQYRPSQERVSSIANVMRRELGPLQMGFSPETRHQLGMDRPDLLGAANRTIMAPFEAAVALFDLARYGIAATIVASTQRAAQLGWISETSAGQLRRDANLAMLVLGAESGLKLNNGMSPIRMAAENMAAREILRASATGSLIVRYVRGGVGPSVEKPFALVEALVEARKQLIREKDPGYRRSLHIEGRIYDKQRSMLYVHNQIRVYKPKSRKYPYVILDSYQPRPGTALPTSIGPVSRKSTQFWEIDESTALYYLNEANSKYRPGRIFANVPSTAPVLRNRPIVGQLILEVPRQYGPIPQKILDEAKRLNIIIREDDTRFKRP